MLRFVSALLLHLPDIGLSLIVKTTVWIIFVYYGKDFMYSYTAACKWTNKSDNLMEYEHSGRTDFGRKHMKEDLAIWRHFK